MPGFRGDRESGFIPISNGGRTLSREAGSDVQDVCETAVVGNGDRLPELPKEAECGDTGLRPTIEADTIISWLKGISEAGWTSQKTRTKAEDCIQRIKSGDVQAGVAALNLALRAGKDMENALMADHFKARGGMEG